MKKSIIYSFFILISANAIAQEHLVVEGDASIQGKLDLDDGTATVIIGPEAGLVNAGVNNVFVGLKAGRSNDRGLENTFLGDAAGQENTQGRSNTFMGAAAGIGNSGDTSDYNTYIGADAGRLSFGGVRNTFVGSNRHAYD